MKKYSNIWDKVNSDIKKKFDSKPACDKKFLITKAKSCGNKATDIRHKEMPKVSSNHTCLAVITIDSVL